MEATVQIRPIVTILFAKFKYKYFKDLSQTDNLFSCNGVLFDGKLARVDHAISRGCCHVTGSDISLI